jgi:hypothetical protein
MSSSPMGRCNCRSAEAPMKAGKDAFLVKDKDSY